MNITDSSMCTSSSSSKVHDWIHCNVCYRPLFDDAARNNVAIYMTSCGHLLCHSCLRKAGYSPPFASIECAKCHQHLINVIDIGGAQMNKQIRSFFSAPEDAVKVATSRIVKLIEFRQEHVNRMLAIQQKQAKNCYLALQQCQQTIGALKSENVELQQHHDSIIERDRVEIEALRTRLNNQKAEIREFQTSAAANSRPPFNHFRSYDSPSSGNRHSAVNYFAPFVSPAPTASPVLSSSSDFFRRPPLVNYFQPNASPVVRAPRLVAPFANLLYTPRTATCSSNWKNRNH